MKHNLIKTDNYLLMFGKLSEIKEGDWYKTPLDIYSQFNGTEKLPVGTKRVVAHLPLNGAPYLDDVDSLPPMGNDEEDDIEVLANKMTNHLTFPEERREGIVCGYNKARETYEFTKEDMRKAIIMSSLSTVDFIPDRCDVIIQTIQQSKLSVLPVAFEFEVERVCRLMSADIVEKEGWIKVENTKSTYTRVKTIINSEGRIEWVGKYIY